MNKKAFGGVILAGMAFVMLGVAVARAADTGGISDDTVAQKIVAAKTAADHEALASFYSGKAEAANSAVKRHEAMVRSYADVAGKSKVNMVRHCEALLQSYKQEAKQYETLAKEHSDLAKSVH